MSEQTTAPEPTVPSEEANKTGVEQQAPAATTETEEPATTETKEPATTETKEPAEEAKPPTMAAEVKMEISTTEDEPIDEKAASADPAPQSAPIATTETEETANIETKVPVTAEIEEPATTETKVPVTAETEEPATTETKEPATEAKPTQQPQSTLPTRQYLDATVVPILHAALSQLAKVRPQDPIHFLGNYLLEYKETVNQRD